MTQSKDYSFYPTDKFMSDLPEMSKHIFCFGSNIPGFHGAGAALTAKKMYGAIQGQGEGLHGQSYALPTVAVKYGEWYELINMDLKDMEHHVKIFMKFAATRPDLCFFVTAIGTGLAGHNHADIAPLFSGAPTNCVFPEIWRQYL